MLNQYEKIEKKCQENWGKKFQGKSRKKCQKKPKKANIIVFNKKVANCI